ncbi:MAG TPA: methyl-accepting chemotaxis protein [Vicinamibacterales bacterium]|jgi:methyl-accepting chemotaxis protein
MKRFANLKTMTKLMSAFAVLIAVMVGIGYLGLHDVNVTNEMLDTLYQRDMMGSMETKNADALLLDIGRVVATAMVARDAADARQLTQQADADFATFPGHFEKAEKSATSAEEKAKFAEIKQMFASYESDVRLVLNLDQSSRKDEAATVLQRSRDTARGIRARFDEVTKWKDQLGRRAFDEADVVYQSSVRTMVVLIVLAALFAIGVGYGIGRMIAKPLGAAVTVLQAVANGDYTQRLEVTSTDETGQLGTALNQAVGGIRKALEEVRTVADNVAAASQQLSSASQEIASGAQEQASSIEETAASLEEITSTVKQNADNAQQANQLASGSRDVAQKGGQVVSEAVGAMAEINQASKRIADIITAIDEIAFQTNLLALNAAVEAARAGEQGRGFAVVAAEVRNLAQRSATAAKEIKGLIQDSVRKVEAGSELVNKSGSTLQEIMTSVKHVTDIVSEIAAASREQTSGIDQVNKAVSQMDQVTQANASQTEEMSGTAESLAAQAEQLQDLVARFKLEAEGEDHRAVRARARRTEVAPTVKKKTVARMTASRPAPPSMTVRPTDASNLNAQDSGFVEF